VTIAVMHAHALEVLDLRPGLQPASLKIFVVACFLLLACPYAEESCADRQGTRSSTWEAAAAS